jgi:ADP-ribosyl-[dinitrogen reductase] hydrolase
MSNYKLTGHCLFGEISFEVDTAQAVLFNNCYCKSCQRNSVAGFVSQLQIPRTGFRWLKGESSIRLYESSPGVNRAFYSVCGSRLPLTEVPGDYVLVPVGLLNEDPNLKPEINMFMKERASWALLDEKIPCLQDHGSAEFWTEYTRNNS